MACQSSSDNQPLSQEELITKGEYLVMVGGCNDCHTPKKLTPQGPVPDMSLLLSGHPQDSELPDLDPSSVGPGKWVRMNENLTAFVGPWGMTFSANLTPDEQTGIGLWEEEHFVNAMRNGKHMGMGRPILPPMPWFNLTQAKDEDLKAIFAYFKSIKPIAMV
jgi:mono/diheme cytochrome c family protein